MTRLKMSLHHHASRGSVVEIHDDDRGLIATIYPFEGGIKIVSKYLPAGGNAEGLVRLDKAFPPALEILIP